jgi:hypothetical protein
MKEECTLEFETAHSPILTSEVVVTTRSSFARISDSNHYIRHAPRKRETKQPIVTMTAPKKYIKINGVMKLNPEYKKFQEAQSGGTPVTTVARPDAALPVVCSMDDYAQFNEDLGTDTPLSESTNAAIEMMQEPEICVAAGSKFL